MTVKVAAKKKSPTKAELVRRLGELEKELAKLKDQVKKSKPKSFEDKLRKNSQQLHRKRKRKNYTGNYSNRRIVVKYGLPDAPHAHLLVFKDGSKEILPDETAVNAWINDRAKKQPIEIWQMKKRTIVKA